MRNIHHLIYFQTEFSGFFSRNKAREFCNKKQINMYLFSTKCAAWSLDTEINANNELAKHCHKRLICVWGTNPEDNMGRRVSGSHFRVSSKALLLSACVTSPKIVSKSLGMRVMSQEKT